MAELPSECNVKVVARVRPLNDSEERAGSKFILKFPADDSVSIGGKVFLFDRVLKPEALQSEVYDVAAKPIVKDVMSGYNGTIFAYGQTASGKTHTMEGVIGNSELQGIIPRIIGDIFQYIYQMEVAVEFHIKVSYFEIYMDKIRDLLDISKTNLSVHEDKNRVPYVKGATEKFVASPEEVLEVIDMGKANRHVAVTNMNEHSSRSHSVFLICVTSENTETEKKLSGKLYLVDLAGSEKVSKTGAEGSVLDEAKNINKSLSALGNVIAALADANGHIPYRDSKLTRILQESLGGNARTTMVICCSPATFNETETKSTLLFGQRAKTIKNSVTVNEELTAEEWRRRYEKEKDKNARLRGLIERLEAELSRWRAGEAVPEDERLMVKDTMGEPAVGEGLGNAGPTPTTPVVATAASGGVSDAEKERWELEKQNLYQQLDDKDDEIDKQCQMSEKLQEQIVEMEEQITAYIKERDNAAQEILQLQTSKESSTQESRELLGALEELGEKYEQAMSSIESKEQENAAFSEDLRQKKKALSTMESDFAQLRESSAQQRKRSMEMLLNLLKELGEMSSVVGCEFKIDLQRTSSSGGSGSTGASSPAAGSTVTTVDKLDEDFTMARLYVSKMKSEVKSLLQKSSSLESSVSETSKRLEHTEQELSESKLLVEQHEAKLRTVGESLKEGEAKRRTLEEQVDKLEEDCARLKAQEQLYMGQLAEKEREKDSIAASAQMKETLEKQMEQHREQHQKQLNDLRHEISTKQQRIDQLAESEQKLCLTHERLKTDYDKLKVEDNERSTRLTELSHQMERQEQARQDLSGLEDTVARELHTLHNLRKLFVQDLHSKVRKMKNEDDEQNLNVQAQKQTIAFLQNNLDQLTSVHKQLVRDNADLRCELPKLEKRLRATNDRVKSLETSLKEAKEGAMRDRKRYQQEVDRIKEAVRQKNLVRRGNVAQIAKPIRAGHAPPPAPQPIGIRGGGGVPVGNSSANVASNSLSPNAKPFVPSGSY